MYRRSLIRTLVIIALASVIGAAGCTRQAPSEPSRTPAPSGEQTGAAKPTTDTDIVPTDAPAPLPPDDPAEKVAARVYFVRDEKIGVAARDVDGTAPARAAMQALLEGPSSREKEFGLASAIPAGTKLNGINIVGGTATVDLSKEFASGGGSLSMQLRAAQVVCTLTQFPTVKRVSFRIDGSKTDWLGGEGLSVGPSVTRADMEHALPAILVEAPAVGASVGDKFTVSGTSNVFEATHQIQVTDPDGLVVVDKTVTATSGTGTRGTRATAIDLPPLKRDGLGAIIVFEYSAKDGSKINLVEIPVDMRN